MRALLLAMVIATACARVDEQKPPRRVPESWETSGGSRLRALFAVRGGVRQFIAFEDTRFGVRCTPIDEGAGYYCKPHTIALRAFGDEKCTALTVAVDETCDGSRKVISNGLDGAPFFAARPVDRAFGSGCAAVETSPSAKFWVATEEIPRSSFVGFRRENVAVGPRLERIMLVGDDGSRFGLGYRDPRFETECFFTEAADGRRRCLPATNPTQTWNVDCSKRVVIYATGSPAPRVAVGPIGTCGAPTAAYAAKDVGFIPIAFRDASGACRTSTSTSPAAELGEEVPASEFAEEELERVGDARLSQWVTVLDRARIPRGIEDQEFGRCRFQLDNGAYRCLPEAPGFSTILGLYADEGCTRAIACGGPARCGETKQFLTHRVGCELLVRQVGASIEKPPATFGRRDGVCEPNGLLGCKSFVELSEVIPPSSFATAELVAD